MSRRGSLLVFLLALGVGACASTGAVPKPFPTPGASAIPRSESPATPATTDPNGASSSGTAMSAGIGDPVAGAGYAIAGTALALRGSPYRSGGADPSGFDCSGFIWYVFAQHGIHVPRTVVEQYQAGINVATDALEPGDLLFFSTEAPGASHVGMAIGGDQFVHAPSSRGIVRVEHLSASYWSSRYVGAKRMR